VPRGELEFVERAGIDEVDRDAERNAESDGNDRERGAAGIFAQRTQYQGVQQQVSAAEASDS
jgi:hypothetical protein